ncbi:hypothetical protein C4E15_06590 [Achromobacter spanius]|uniref:DUF551 domain-containing protein n=1 Tax=Achromobacter spanius TaxID=217203 RepID=A0A2S5GXY8_9BURK|nr:DUF551 domain-containing protein [Achromobacter spanius]PPA77671.1 hypothetical protein C4E15_06590 [Achromobacter spanius]
MNTEWKPIESAPKDGTPIIIACIGEGRVYDVCNGHIEVLLEDEEDGPWGINGGEPFCSYVGRAAGEYFCCWLPGKEWEDRWKIGPDFEYTHWMPLPPAPTSHPIPTGATGERDWELACDQCNGSGHVFVKHQVAERKTDVQEFKEECEACEGRGFNIDFEDIPGIAEYVKSCRPAATVATGEDGRSATYGMTLGERIAHVGGRTNAQSYTEFGSPMAVNALIQHVLRDLDWTRQDDDGAYQARYRLPGGQWSGWGHVVCGVKGHEQELRYLPGERRPAPAAGDALDALRELVACDNIKKQIASMQVCVLETDDDVQELDGLMSDLARRQPAAWDAARAAIAQQKGEA